MWNEFKARFQYTLFSLLAVDGSWEMNGDLCGGLFPWDGYWLTRDFRLVETYKECRK